MRMICNTPFTVLMINMYICYASLKIGCLITFFMSTLFESSYPLLPLHKRKWRCWQVSLSEYRTPPIHWAFGQCSPIIPSLNRRRIVAVKGEFISSIVSCNLHISNVPYGLLSVPVLCVPVFDHSILCSGEGRLWPRQTWVTQKRLSTSKHDKGMCIQQQHTKTHGQVER